MTRLPDPERVRTRADFVTYVDALVASLDAALAEPEPPPYVDDRGGWTNWSSRYRFWEAMTGWMEYKPRPHVGNLRREPIAAVLFEPVEEPTEWRDIDGLRSFLVSVRDWAADPEAPGPPAMWRNAAIAMFMGAVYE